MPLANRHLLVAALALVAVCAGPVSSASADRSFAPRYQTHTRGNLAMAANTLLSCPAAAAACASTQAATGGNPQNNNWVMSNVDADGDPTTFNSSTATLDLPATATVTFAGLYWGADTSAGASGADAPAPGFASAALLDTPGPGGYQAVTGSQHDLADGAWSTRYQDFSDVTAEVAAAGAGDYTLANVQAGTGNDRYAGWTLVVAYRELGEPVRSLTVYDGLVTVQNSTTSLALDGFEAPGSGSADTNLGLVSYEGDLGLTGDSARLNGTTLSDAANPANNFFNSSITAGGSRVTTKSPDYVNQLGLDADVVAVDGLIPAGATSANLELATAGDTYFMGVVTLATDQIPEAPSNGAAPSVSGTAEDGQTLSADPGAWSGTDPMDFGYQWQRCDATGANCADIAGATGSTYELGDDDAGNTVQVVVTATNDLGSQTATSAPSAVVAAQAPSDTGAPTISGAQRAGEVLSAANGSWSGTGPLGYSYQWQRCDSAGGNCVDIAGATGSTYELTADDVGSTIVVIVTATNPGGSDSAASAPSAPVAAQLTPPAEEQPPAADPSDGDAGNGSGSGSATTTAGLALAPGTSIAPASCQQLTGTQVLAFKVPTIRFRIRVAPSGRITAARPLLAASPVSAANAWKLNRYVRRVVYRLGGRRIATRRRAPYAVRIGPSLLSRATRQTLTVRVVPKRGKPRVARVQLNSRPCSELFTVVHRPSPRRSLLGLRVDSVKQLRGVVFRVPVRLLAKPGSRGVAGKLRLGLAGRRAMNFRLSFPRRKTRATTLLAGAGRPHVRVSGGRITVSGLPAGTAGIRLRLRARGMTATPRATLRALVQTDGSSRRLTQRLGHKRR